MAKAREIPDLTPGLSYGEVGARVLEVRTAELIDHSEGVLDTGAIDRLHDMRVSTRRLRAVIEVFRPCFPPAERKRALRSVEALADALGERRDRDVAIVALEEFATQMPAPDRRGVASLVERFRSEQTAANEELGPFIDTGRLAELEQLLGELAAAARRSGEKA